MDWKERTPGWVHDERNIKGFFGEYRWLSNFHECEVEYNGLVFKSSEAGYQAAKSYNPSEQKRFTSMSPSEAKKEGQKLVLPESWSEDKAHIMEGILYSKFSQNEDLREKLLETGDKYLEETNWWNDTYWGVCKGKGENNLGSSLMSVRDSIRRE